MWSQFKHSYFFNENFLLGRPNLLKNGDNYDKALVLVLSCLLCLGLVMVFSASAIQNTFENRFYYLIRQAEFATLGLIAALILSYVPLWRWQRWARYLLGLAILSLIVVLLTGDTVKGAVRWIRLPLGFNFQPSELLKLATILYVADFFKRKVDILHDFHRVKWVAVPIAIAVALVLLTRDLGSAIVVVGLFLALLYLVNMPMKWFWSAVGIGLWACAVIIFSSDFRMRRISVMWKPWEDPTGTGFQGLGSLMSLHEGGLWGKGLGNAVVKHGFLPEAHTDFILAVMGEELGMVAVIALMFTYLWLIRRAFSIAKQARDLDLHFNFFVGIGIGLWVAAQSFINIGVNISLLPNKGLTLPLISYGGTSLFLMMIAFTLLLRVDYENRRVLRGFNVADPRERLPENTDLTNKGEHHE
ncbi:MAG: putative lipid II flippase FtsW [Alysiella sp.]|uniref:putative lipid II flippase FtsW n=1 Tax=Alysiella sp. TaxID=1872483 RepID=UPI0026DC6DA1|nr:putative lipid II flippase FtsW [Alysiella sp.]MDO4433663.1 putative lipid II flippase FtsW [Alysiella sp.]